MNVPISDIEHQEIPASEDTFGDVRKILLKYLSYWKWFVISFIVLAASGYGYLSTLVPQYRISASILIKDHKKGDGVSMLEELDLFYKANVVENEIEILRSYTLLEEVVDDLNLQVRYSLKEGWQVSEENDYRSYLNKLMSFSSLWQTKEVYGNLPIKIEIVNPTDELFSRPFILRFEGDRVIFDEKQYPRNALITESFGSILLISTSVNDSLPILWDNENPIIVNFIPKASLIESLHNSLQVALVKNTSVINLSIHSPVPQLGKDILNQLIIAYNKAAITDKNNMAGIALNFIEERLEVVGEDLRSAEQNVEQYKVTQGITNISTESSMFLQNIQKYDAELSKVRIQLDVLRQIEQNVLSETGSTSPAMLDLSDPILVSLIAALNEAETERIRLLSTTQPASVRVQALDDQIQALKEKLIDNIYVMRRSLETTQQNLRADSRRIESVINSIPQKERELVDITREQEIINQLYIFLLSKREETAISYAATVADSRIVDPARSTPYPVQPDKKMILMMFGLVGLLLPVGVLWLIDCFNSTISLKEDIENYIKAPVVGEISIVEQAASKIVVYSKIKSRQAEQIRTLRTNIEFMRAGGGIKVILITSGISGEGKSFLSANLGAAYAAMGKKTVILGFDLRKPGLDKVFGINNNEGLSNYLAGQATLDQIIHATKLSDNLHIITCGHIAPNPQELLLGNTLSQLFDQLKEKYECIVLDTSPIGLMSDAMILGHFADVSLYVIRQNYTPRDRIKYINELYHAKRLKNLGVVVNGIKDKNWNGYGYGSYKYYYKYYESSR